MQAYSLDLRQRVVSAYEKGVETILEVAERFEVSDSFVKKLLRRKRLSEKHRKWLLKTVLAAPDMTLEDLREQLLSEHRVSASLATVCRELRALNLRRKKSRWSLSSETSKSEPGIGGG